MKPSIAALVLALVAVAVPSVLAQSPAEDAALRAATRLESPAAQVKAFRAFLTTYPQSKLAPAAHFLLTRALVGAKASTKDLVDEARLTLELVPATREDLLQFRVETALTVAEALVVRKEQLDAARELVANVASGLSVDPETASLRHILALADASILAAAGKHDESLAAVRKILAEDPDHQPTLVELGDQLRDAGKVDEAIEAYVAAEAVYQGQPIEGVALRELYRKKTGSLDGLDARLDTARKASLRRFALDSRRISVPAPDWTLTDLAGKSVKLSDLKGQIVVIDFWATWCGPCRMELPHIQALETAFNGKGVRVVGVNVEGSGDRETWEKTVRSFVESNKYTFTVVNDFAATVNASYQVDALPSVFVVDRTGTIRYFNRGFEPTIRDVLTTQIESLTN